MPTKSAALEQFEFRAPGRIITGLGCVQGLGKAAAQLGLSHVLLVTTPPLRDAGAEARVATILRDAGITVTSFPHIAAEPTTEDVEAAWEQYQAAHADGVVGLGGGSVLDVAKGLAMRVHHPGPLSRYEGVERFSGPRAPVVAISTTAGTGSEVTRYIALTDRARNVKMLLTSVRLIPDVAIDDPELTVTAPPQVTAAAGVDALTHAVEAYVSRRAQPLSDALALNAIRLIAGWLPRAWAHGDDLPARAAVLDGALQAGLAFSNASVALVHGMARPLGAYFQIPHGLANAVLLPHVLAYSVEAAAPRYAAVARALGAAGPDDDDHSAAQAAVTAISRLCRDVEVPSLTDLGVTAERLHEVANAMAADALASGSPAHNPRVPTPAEIVDLYERALYPPDLDGRPQSSR